MAEATKSEKKAKKEKAPKVGRIVYPIDSIKDPAIVKNGKLLKLPPDFDSKKHKRLSESAFADKAGFMDFRAFELSNRIAALTKVRDGLVSKAENFRKFGDENLRKKADKLIKMRAEHAALEEELRKAGITV